MLSVPLMAPDPLEIVAGTADAAVGTDEEGRVVIWNRAAEKLLGYGAAEVLGKPCHEVLCGRDTCGNRYCDENCALEHMVLRHEAVRHFRLAMRKSSGQFVDVSVSVVVVPGPRPSQFTILHLLQPLAPGDGIDYPAERIATGAVPLPSVSLASNLLSDRGQLLTTRETEILRLLADGCGTQEIADRLFISVATVRNHVQNILRKLDVHSKLEAVSLALRSRLI
ncbi:MAG TPA: LuxR C-terminal-related transcriptional regulator [Thermoanaerobaculia bacterium]